MSAENIKVKQAVVDEIKGKLEKAESVVLIDYLGITVAEADNMRKRLRDENVDYKVYKNTLIKRAIDGTDYLGLEEMLDGPSAMAISYDDATAPARVLNGLMKEYKKMEFKAGFVEGTLYDADGMKKVASIPSREELLAKFLGSIQSPVGTFVRTLQAIADEKPAEAAVEAKAEEATEAKAEEAKPEEAVEAKAEEATAEEATEAKAEETTEEKA